MNKNKLNSLLTRLHCFLTSFYFTYDIIIFGFILLVLYFWGRFLRVRLPRDIPFFINNWILFILLVICSSYIYAIFKTLKPKNPPELVKEFLNKILLAVIAFDDYLKQFSFISKCYINIFSYLAKLINPNNLMKWKIVVILFNLVPHMTLLLVLYFDIFHFAKLASFYKFIPISLLLFIIPFSIYSLNYVKNHLIQYWENNIKYIKVPYVRNVLPPSEDPYHDDFQDDEEDPYDYSEPLHCMYIKLKPFLKLYFEHLYYPEEEIFEFYYLISFYEPYNLSFFKKYNLDRDKFDFAMSDFRQKVTIKDIDAIIKIELILLTYQKLILDFTLIKILKYAKIIVLILYLIAWSSIFYLSVYSEDILNLLEFITKISSYVAEPFSGINFIER